MKKLYLSMAGIFAGSLLGFAQTPQHRCGTDEAMEQVMTEHPEVRDRINALNQHYKQVDQEFEQRKAQRGFAAATAVNAVPDTIPVVFHIVHEYGGENISDDLIKQALVQINIDYAKQDPDTSEIRPTFKGIATAANIVFALAKKDPNGNCTSGIERYYDPARTHWAQANASTNYAYSWPSSKYLNIYIVNEIISSSGSSGGIVVGYTYVPGTWGNDAAQDAIVYNYGFLSGKASRSLSHEMGHWLGLIHTFGNTNNAGGTGSCTSANDDGISDTPRTQGYFSTCPGATSTYNCVAGVEENVQNYMDYSSCPNMFSAGQVNKMKSVLASSTSKRNNLVSAANLNATGVRNVTSVCAPEADFSPYNFKMICEGSTISFTDASWGGPVTSRTWNFPGGTIMTGTDTTKNVVVKYPTAGVYDVSLTAGNSTGNTTKTRTGKIYVTSTANAIKPNNTYGVSFEDANQVSSELTNFDISGDNSTWTRATTAGYNSSSSYKLSNNGKSPGLVDEFVLPELDLTNMTGISVTFRVSYRLKSSTNNDKLRVLVSTNCGEAWTPRKTISASSTSTTGLNYSTAAQTSAFTPTTASQWSLQTVSLSNSFAQSHVRLKFEFTSGGGNNIYIDDINITGTVGGKEVTISADGVNIAPNPTSAGSTVSLNLWKNSENTTVTVCDVLGKQVATVFNGALSAGEHQFEISRDALRASGIYFVTIKSEDGTVTKRLVVN